jgi:hypothetical protein
VEDQPAAGEKQKDTAGLGVVTESTPVMAMA